MKKPYFSTVFLVLCSIQYSFAAPASTQSIEELLKITKTEQLIEQTQAQVLPVMQESMNQSLESQGRTLTDKEKIKIEKYLKESNTLILNELNWKALKQDFIQIYAESFSQEEIDGLITFYKTPVGQSTIEKMPMVMNKSMTLMQSKIQSLMPKIMNNLEKNFKD
ncbi:hypothetical protein A7P53_02775 [Acinetobacter defluvii]|uniref:DUF2059 domain-containing protein n=1 Tax=Acinetobacter defluvii TaxID=1871111 RepID=UPI00148F97CB|nr:DUF2059 domain-containing protein [Acinetobacter defluvii]NNP71358.1 hypothetical protein [Acinetobacter defluvii]